MREKDGEEWVVVSELLLSISCYIMYYLHTVCIYCVFSAISCFLHYSDTLRAGLVCRLWIMWIWSYTLVYRDCELAKDLDSYLTPLSKAVVIFLPGLLCLGFPFFPHANIPLPCSLQYSSTELRDINLHSMCCYALLQDNHEEQPANNPDSCLLQERASALHVSRHH